MNNKEMFCNDYGDSGSPNCAKEIDHKYDMDFSPHGMIYWCRVCGPRAHELQNAIMKALKTRPGFEKELAAEVDKAEKERVKH